MTRARALPLRLYGLATAALEPLAPVILARRAAAGKEDRVRIGERLGRPSVSRPDGPLVWLHGVSVGESLSLLPLVERLRARRPDLALLVTSGTVTSAQVLAGRLPPGVIHQFAPVDAPGAVRRFLDHWRPAAGLLAESELWPNLILAAKARGVRLAMVSARMTQKSAEGWAKAPSSARALLSGFDLILPQDAITAERLERLGGEPGPALNLKLAADPLPVSASELAQLSGAVGGRQVVLAASTHPGDEALIAGAAPPDALLIVAPRHPDRGPAVAEILAAEGRAVARRGANEPLTPAATAYVADTLGELGLLIRLADVVVMGGAFTTGIGGHNPLDAARLGKPVITGPHAFNAAEIYAQLFAEAAAIEAPDAETLARHIRGLLAYPVIAQRIGEAGLSFAARQGRALDLGFSLIDGLLPA